ncbi:MAG: hypothetical protein IJR83_06205 [Clostridia bacterium]|nr:hypothetical protein [Clostridia bacterium]
MLHKVLIILIALLTVSVLIASVVLIAVTASARPSVPSSETKKETDGQDSQTDTKPDDKSQSSAQLPPSQDAGSSYQDSLTFFGESTTFHMIARGVLSGGTATQQVIKPVDTTITLRYFDKDVPVIHPVSGESVPFSDCIADLKPECIVLTFGINGVVGNSGSSKNVFLAQYETLIDLILEKSPGTVIILQDTFPVADVPQIEDTFGLTATELNQKIAGLNESVKQLAEQKSVYYLHTFEILTGPDGNLPKSYLQSSQDGIHLNEEAYQLILQYIRTHAYPST